MLVLRGSRNSDEKDAAQHAHALRIITLGVACGIHESVDLHAL
jgi:hypothetical protein